MIYANYNAESFFKQFGINKNKILTKYKVSIGSTRTTLKIFKDGGTEKYRETYIYLMLNTPAYLNWEDKDWTAFYYSEWRL